ncbi:hypothetical protein VCR15J2_470539 [Vibrio coralliirubri]|nr:hypothetical protein VCR15J2_470539 [Vibrio coralliirubri]
MITKDRDSKIDNSLQQKAGAKVEQDVAFYLRREFGDAKNGQECPRLSNKLSYKPNY